MRKGFKRFIAVCTSVLTVFAFANVFSFDSHAVTGSTINPLLRVCDSTTGGNYVDAGTATVSTSTPEIVFEYDSSAVDYIFTSYVNFDALSNNECTATLYFASPLNSDVTISVNISFIRNGVSYTSAGTVSGSTGDTSVTYIGTFVPGSSSSSSSSGSLTPEQSYMKSTERFANEIADASALAASTKKNVKIEYSTGSALPMNIMRAMTESKNVTLEYTFEFLGYKFKTTITPEAAQKAFKEDIPWYGPYYLASNFQTVVVGVAD